MKTKVYPVKRMAMFVLCWCMPASVIIAGEVAELVAGNDSPKQGVCAVLGDVGSKQAIALAGKSEWLLYEQFADAGEAEAAREAVAAAGFYGTRIFIEQADSKQINLADNLADAVVVLPGVNVPDAEVMRVLNPNGKALVGGKQLTKPFPKGMDDWSHPYHGADNNPMSRDKEAVYPYRTQFIVEPKFSSMPEVTVAAGGRVFTAHGSAASHFNQYAVVNTLQCFNGYNGVMLWKRPLKEGFLIHRSTMVATPDVLYLADDESCKLLDARTGAVKDQIIVPSEMAADGIVWKWLALDNGVLYALLGGAEAKVSPHYLSEGGIGRQDWGMLPGKSKDAELGLIFGRTLAAFDVKAKKVLWHYRSDEFVDERSICMRNGRIYFYAPQHYLACLDGKTGAVIWKRADPEMLAAMGKSKPGNTAFEGFATSPYVKCTDKYLILAGPQRPSLVVVDVKDGKIIWQHENGNFQLVLRDDAIYAVGCGDDGKNNPNDAKTIKFDYATGKEMGQCLGRHACTRATGSADSIFYRADEGTIRLDCTGETIHPSHIPVMRPSCNDGVIISDGLLYWTPWSCKCSLELRGTMGLCHADEVKTPDPADTPQLEKYASDPGQVKDFAVSNGDWAEYLGNPGRSYNYSVATTVPEHVKARWTYTPATPVRTTAPVVAGGLVFVGNDAGVVSAIGADDGKLRWKSYAGGQVVYPPAVWNGRVYAGSCDGWVYAWEAATGRRLWRFRAAPAGRRINVFGRLSSPWPVAGGIVVHDGVLYAAANLAAYDGMYVYALDAVTGQIKWVNDKSGHMSSVSGDGVTLMSSLAFNNSQVSFKGGGNYLTAGYDAATGKCKFGGFDLLRTYYWTDAIYAYYPEYGSFVETFVGYPGGKTLSCSSPSGGEWGGRGPTMSEKGKPKPLWQNSWLCMGLVAGANGIVVARETTAISKAQHSITPAVLAPRAFALTALKLEDGATLWEEALPASPVKDAIAMDHAKHLFVSLADGSIMCWSGE